MLACLGCIRAEEALKQAQVRILELQAQLASARQQLEEVQKLSELQAADLKRLEAEIRKVREGRNQPERVSSDQLFLAFIRLSPELSDEQKAALQPPAPAHEDISKTPTPRARRGGRRRLEDEDLEVIEQREVPEEVQACGGRGWRQVGEEISEKLAYQPGRFVRIRLIREKWVRCDEMGAWQGAPVTAPLPGWVLPRLMADTSVLAHTLVSKYGFSLPLHRQEQMLALEGFEIARSTMSDWTEAAFELAAPVVAAMHAESLSDSYCLATDATGAPVRAHKGRILYHLFVFIADAGHITFLPCRRHSGETIRSMLGDFRGALLSDAASIYKVVHTLGVLFVACWAHVRRYFWRATLTEPELAHEGMVFIARIFENERKMKRLSGNTRATARREHTQPIIDAMDAWALRVAPRADVGGALERALVYYSNQREALGHFVDDPLLEAHNNDCERELRALVLGKHNWMHFENKTGLAWYAGFRSLIASCRLHELNPVEYLEQMLRIAGHWPEERKIELSPKYWRATRAALTPEQKAIVQPRWTVEKARSPPRRQAIA